MRAAAVYQLTKSDVEVIFSGAPYFLLDQGKQDHWYPQVIFPFDDHDPTIQCLGDRQTLPYPSYTLCTLHAHLPVRSDWMIEADRPVQLDSWHQTRRAKRASFDLEVFEVPNMLSLNGMEAGSVGFHYFLEMPVADSVRFVGPAEPTPVDDLRWAGMPAAEAFEVLEHRSQPYALCTDGTVHDRGRLLMDGPNAWKRIGVRDADVRRAVARLQTLKDLRNEILHGESAKTLLDLEGPKELYDGLVTDFLYPFPRSLAICGEDPHGLLAQIKALTTVLATPGAWFDFSLPEWRLRIGQVLWEASPLGGDDASDKPWACDSLERKWLLVQMVLAAELLLRLDATVRIGLLRMSYDVHVTAWNIRNFERLRSAKVTWDMIAARRVMDSFNFGFSSSQFKESQTTGSEGKQSEKHRFSFKHHQRSSSVKAQESAWACRLVPEHVDRQLQGLLLFAENIGWPTADLKDNLCAIYHGEPDKVRDAYNKPIQPEQTGFKDCDTMYSRSSSYRPLALRRANIPEAELGWVTRTWFSGLVLPGEGISHLLMGALLENDFDALTALGPVANLYGGFAYCGRSWWSRECIVGRILASLSTNNCMGWIGSSVLPQDSRTLELLRDTWFEVNVTEPPSRVPRIKQGKKISMKSTPLGLGELTSGVFSLPVDADERPQLKIDFQSLAFVAKNTLQLRLRHGTHAVTAQNATMTFFLRSGRLPETVSFSLTYNVQFITSHECRPPGGLVYRAPRITEGLRSTGRKYLSRLPGHPLHRSYTYKVIPLEALPGISGPDSDSDAKTSHPALKWREILVVDARGGPDQEAFARAWCASVGYHAIVGRVGRTCLACCIREARAVKVRVVIRVGDWTCNDSPLQNHSRSIQRRSM
ncbi:hypothetical protein BJX61DRAFT_337415 [Aspergillus egyptiacus]|nr:hypothetical protein BJX61DRAFT_337415 [Aspergillus egyptiacus]